MPSVTAILNYGALPDIVTMVDEANILIQSLTVTPKREEKRYKGAATRATEGISMTDPTLTFAFKAYVSAEVGLSIQHPGTQVATLANFAGATYGFSPSDGIMLYKDPSRELSIDNPDMISFTVEHLPFVTP